MKIGKIYLKDFGWLSVNELAFALMLKYVSGKKGCIKGASVSHLAYILRLSRQTTKKYIDLLAKKGIVYFEGKRNSVLRIIRLHSNSSFKNVKLNPEKFDFSSFKSAIMSVRAAGIAYIEYVKESVKSMTAQRENPKNLEELKKITRDVRHVKGYDPSHPQFRDYGTRLSTYAKRIKNSVGTVQKAIKFMVGKSMMEVFHHYEQLHAPGINYQNPAEIGLEDYNFATKDNIYKIKPNTHKIDSCLFLYS